jgi:hypothetical protein
MRKSEIFAQAAFAELRDALRNAEANRPGTGTPFAGSGNCLANLERDYAARNGGHWFDRDAMRFFGTRFASGFLDVPAARTTLFVTTEKPPHGPRRASLRAYLWDTGCIATPGPFCDHTPATVADGMAIVAAQLSRA